jgi:hypothetical protein
MPRGGNPGLKPFRIRSGRGMVATVLTHPGIFFENRTLLHITQQPHNREKSKDCSLIDKSKDYLSIKQLKSIGQYLRKLKM